MMMSALLPLVGAEVTTMTTGVRRPPGRHKGRYIGKWMSVKTGEVMFWESQLERALLRLLEWDTAVRYYLTQPFRIFYLDEGKVRRYTPDVLVEINQKIIIEVKPESKTLDTEFQRWVSIVRNTLSEEGYAFEIRTERDIQREPKLSNVTYLLRYRRHPVPEEIELSVKRWVREEPGLSLGEVIDRLGGTPEALCQSYALMVRHAVRYDIEQPFSRALPLLPFIN